MFRLIKGLLSSETQIEINVSPVGADPEFVLLTETEIRTLFDRIIKHELCLKL